MPITKAKGSSLPEYDSVAELSAATGLSNGQLATTRGYYSIGDGGHGTYRYDSSSSATVNGGTVINASGGVGRWLLLHDGIVDAKQFGVVGGGSGNQVTILQTIADWLGYGKSISFDGDRYAFNGAVTITNDNASIIFNGTIFLVGDTGTNGTLVNGSTGKIGFLFKQAHNFKIVGAVEFFGQGTPGTTSLLGICFDNCNDGDCQAFMRFNDMAIGRNMTSCTRCLFGDVAGDTMYGLQTFESPPTSNAGTLENVIGCSYCNFGDAVCYNIEKPVRYLSVGTGAANNSNCNFGSTIGQGRSGSLTSSGVSVRSAVDCNFGPISCNGVTVGLYIVQYSGDTPTWSVNRNIFESVIGDYPSTGSSGDGAVIQETTAAAAIGDNAVGTVNATCAGEFGITITSGTLNIGRCKLIGAATRLVTVYASSGTATLNIDNIEISGNTSSNSPINAGKGGLLNVGVINFSTGPTAAVTAGVRYEPGLGSGTLSGVNIGHIRYRQNGSTNNYTYIAMDLTNGFESWQIDHIDGDGATSQARFADDNFFIEKNKISSTATPTTGTYSVGTVLWKSNVSAAGTPGWLCTTAGAPGTWKAMSNVAA